MHVDEIDALLTAWEKTFGEDEAERVAAEIADQLDAMADGDTVEHGPAPNAPSDDESSADPAG
jgi:hypothetical protein